MGTPLTKTQGKESKKSMRNRGGEYEYEQSRWKRERKQRNFERKGKRVGEGEEEQHQIRRSRVNESSAR